MSKYGDEALERFAQSVREALARLLRRTEKLETCCGNLGTLLEDQEALKARLKRLETGQAPAPGEIREDSAGTRYPDGLEIVTPPARTSYTEGEVLDYTGLQVRLLSGWEPWTGAGYPQGMIPLEELELPVTVARAPCCGSYVSHGMKKSVCTQSDGTGGDLLVPAGTRFCGVKVAGSDDFYVVAVATEPFNLLAYTQDTGTQEAGFAASAMVRNGRTYYVAADRWQSPVPVPTIAYTVVDSGDYATISGIGLDLILRQTLSVPVRWPGSGAGGRFGNCGKTLETALNLEVTAV